MVLPRCARLAGEDVARARLELELERLPHAALLAAEAHARRRPERDPDDEPERRRVPVPADRRAGRVPLHQDLGELLRLDAREVGCALAHGNQPIGDRLGFVDRGASLVVVVDAEVPNGPLCDHAVHTDLVELESLELVEQRALLPLGEEVRPVGEALGSHAVDDTIGRVSAYEKLERIAPLPVWHGIAARVVSGERITLAVVELDPGAVVAEHAHENEQLGLVLRGSMAFRLGGEERELGPGDTWTIPPNTPHDSVAGPEGAVVIDVFAPPRDDWAALEPVERRPPRWP